MTQFMSLYSTLNNNLFRVQEVLVYCPMTQIQKDLYQAVVERSIEDFLNVKKDDSVNTETHGQSYLYSLIETFLF